MNPLSAVNVKFLNKVAEDTVEFGIDLTEFPFLRDPNLLNACMEQFQFMYYPNVVGWQAFIERSQVRIIVIGNVQWDNLKENNV